MQCLTKDQLDRELRERILAQTESMRWHPAYEDWVQGRIWQERYQNPRLQNLKHYVAGDFTNATILDLGSGMGGLLVRLLQEGLHAIGLDYCFDYCGITKLRGMRYGVHTPVINAQAESIPLNDQSVDVILCYEVIEHVFDPVVLLKEMRRVVRPGGIIFISVPNRWSLYDHHYHLWGINLLPRPLAELIIRLLKRDKGGDTSAGVQKLSDLRYFSYKQFVALSTRVGFTPWDVREDKIARDAVAGISNRTRRLISLVRRLGLLTCSYRLYRSTVADAFHFILVPIS